MTKEASKDLGASSVLQMAQVLVTYLLLPVRSWPGMVWTQLTGESCCVFEEVWELISAARSNFSAVLCAIVLCFVILSLFQEVLREDSSVIEDFPLHFCSLFMLRGCRSHFAVPRLG